MRKILFRGKVNRTKWVYGDLIHDERKNRVYIWSEESELIEYIIRPETVGQFTGLHDKNGTKMFEGDIVKWQTIGLDYKIMTIEFNRGGYIAVPVDPELRRPMIRLGSEPEYCEVVGNIHDNPELLKGEEK